MSKKRLLIIGGAVLVALAVVVALLVTSRGPSSSNNAGTGTVPTSTATTLDASGTTAVSTGTPTSGGKATSGGTAAGGSTTSGGSTSSGAGGASPNSAVPTLQVFPALADPGIPAQTVTSPVPKGQTLAPLTAAPDPTISALKLGAVPEGAQYTIRMRPYGIGPSMVFGSRIVLRVDSATPLAGMPANPGIVNTNLLVIVDTTDGGTVTKGGTYSATLTFRSDGTKMLPIMSSAKAAN
jgi:hypothetical protein